MRIASLLAAATEWIAAIGGSDLLVARSHECDFPSEIRRLPAVTSTSVEQGDSRSIDRAVRSTLERGLSLFDVDLTALERLQPDLIITQAQCHVCAISVEQLEQMLAGVLDPAPEIFPFDPRSMKDVLDHALRLGRRLNRTHQTMAFLAEKEKRLREIQDKAGITKRSAIEERPTVACIEWLDPLMTSGNWVPDLVSLAGGRSVCTVPRERSQVVDWGEIVEADPDYIAVMPCGFSIEKTRQELNSLSGRPGWKNLRAVQNGRVYLFDGQAFFNRPGPRLYHSAELLVGMMHSTVPAESWEIQRIKTASKSAG